MRELTAKQKAFVEETGQTVKGGPLTPKWGASVNVGILSEMRSDSLTD